MPDDSPISVTMNEVTVVTLLSKIFHGGIGIFMILPRTRAPSDWGAWLKCANPECQWSGSRDYAAALNIGRLTSAYLVQDHSAKTLRGFRVFDSQLKPLSYSGSGAALPFPPPGSLFCSCNPGTTSNIRGWAKACRLIPLSCFHERASAMLG